MDSYPIWEFHICFFVLLHDILVNLKFSKKLLIYKDRKNTLMIDIQSFNQKNFHKRNFSEVKNSQIEKNRKTSQ